MYNIIIIMYIIIIIIIHVSRHQRVYIYDISLMACPFELAYPLQQTWFTIIIIMDHEIYWLLHPTEGYINTSPLGLCVYIPLSGVYNLN